MGVNMQLGASAENDEKTTMKPDTSPPKTTPQTETKSKAPAAGGFLMTGAKAQEAIKKEEAQAKQRMEDSDKLWRFYIPQNELNAERTITFLDGVLEEDGMLTCPTWYEHTVQLNGRWQNLICVGHEEPCPMCENGDNRTIMAGFSIIDHTPYTIKKGKNAGDTIENSRKLFVPTRTTLGVLQSYAAKRGGLKGWTVGVTRTKDKSPRVGDVFDFLEQRDDAALLAKYGEEVTKPADFNNELTYYNRAELIELGVTAAVGGMVGGDAPSSDLQDQL